MIGSFTFCILFNPLHLHFVVSCSQIRREHIVHEVRSRAHVRSRAEIQAQISKSTLIPSDYRMKYALPHSSLASHPTLPLLIHAGLLASAPAHGLSTNGSLFWNAFPAENLHDLLPYFLLVLLKV